MGQCYFRAVAPKVEIRGDLIFIVPEGAEHEIAFEPRTVSKFVAALNRALDQIHDKSAGNVVPIKVRK